MFQGGSTEARRDIREELLFQRRPCNNGDVKRPNPLRLVVAGVASFVTPKAAAALVTLAMIAAPGVFAGCEDTIPEPVVPKVADSDYCVSAEKNLLALGCEEGKPTKKGKSFTEFCKETQENGIDLKPRCLSTIKSCDQIDKVCAWTR